MGVKGEGIGSAEGESPDRFTELKGSGWVGHVN